MEEKDRVIIFLLVTIAMLFGVFIGMMIFNQIIIPDIIQNVAQKYYDMGVNNAFDKVVSDIEASNGRFGIKTSQGERWFVEESSFFTITNSGSYRNNGGRNG